MDFCLVVDQDIEQVKQELLAKGASIELGPVARHGCRGAMQSIYLRDPTAISSNSVIMLEFIL